MADVIKLINGPHEGEHIPALHFGDRKYTYLAYPQADGRMSVMFYQLPVPLPEKIKMTPEEVQAFYDMVHQLKPVLVFDFNNMKTLNEVRKWLSRTHKQWREQNKEAKERAKDGKEQEAQT